MAELISHLRMSLFPACKLLEEQLAFFDLGNVSRLDTHKLIATDAAKDVFCYLYLNSTFDLPLLQDSTG